MWTPGNDDPSKQLVAALSDGLACLYALVADRDAGTPGLGALRSTWERDMTALEWGMTEVRTNELVTTGYRLTEEDVARVRLIREQMREVSNGGEISPELYRLAVLTLEKMCGSDWREKMAGRAQGDPT